LEHPHPTLPLKGEDLKGGKLILSEIAPHRVQSFGDCLYRPPGESFRPESQAGLKDLEWNA